MLRIILSPSSHRTGLGKVMRNFQRAFDFGPFWLYVRNSVLLVALTTIGTLFSGAFVAYAFAQLHWPGRSFAMLLLLSTMMLPAQVTMIPSFVIWKTLGWYNTLNPMWVPAFFGGAFFIFLMTQQMKTLPRELEESSRIDGLNAVQTWYYIILPQVKPDRRRDRDHDVHVVVERIHGPADLPARPIEISPEPGPVRHAPGKLRRLDDDHGRQHADDAAGDHHLLPVPAVFHSRHFDERDERVAPLPPYFERARVFVLPPLPDDRARR